MADHTEQKAKQIEETMSSVTEASTNNTEQGSSAINSQPFKQDSTMTSNDSKPVTQNTKSSLLYATLVLSIGAFSLSGWQFYQASLQEYDTKLSRISQSNAKLETILAQQTQAVAQVEPIQSALSKVIPALKKLETDDQNTQENTAKLGAEITSVRKQLSRLKNTSKEDWKLAEAEYLVRLANQRLLMEKDIDGAQQLLISADTILAEMKDPILFDTRRALAKDIQALKSTRSFDLEGVYLQLEALSSLVNDLPQKEPNKLFNQDANQQQLETNIDSVESSYSQALLQDIWQTLRSLVIINYNSKPIKPLLPPTQYQQLITGIQLQVNVAQLALMKQESSVYQIALEHIANAVNEHFDIDSAAVSGYLTSLTALQQINVSPELPLPRGALISMKNLMQNWNGKGKNNQITTQAPTQTLGITADKDIIAKQQANDVPDLVKVEPLAEVNSPISNQQSDEKQQTTQIDTSAINAIEPEQTSSPLQEPAPKAAPLTNESLQETAVDDKSTNNIQEQSEVPLTEILETQVQETSL